jgi:hypothetical protein
MHVGLLFLYISCFEDSGLSTTALSSLHPVLIYYIHTLQFSVTALSFCGKKNIWSAEASDHLSVIGKDFRV